MSRPPAILLFVDDLLADPKLRMAGLEACGLWVLMLAIMHKDGEPYGHLKVGGKSLGAKELARLFGASPRRIHRLLTDLELASVFSVHEDGTIYSRRLVRDEEVRQKRAAGGIKSLENPRVPRPKRSEDGSVQGPQEGYPSADPSGGPKRYPPSPSSSPSPSPSSKEEDEPLATVVTAAWNSISGVKPVSDPIPSGIRKKLFARLREHPDPEWWRAYIDRISRSSFLCGKARDWSATFDWVLGPKNMEKILLGNYDDAATAGAKPPRIGCQFVPNVHIGPGRPKPCGQPVASQPGKAKALPFCSEHLGPEEAWRRKQEEQFCGGCDGREKVVAESTLGNA